MIMANKEINILFERRLNENNPGYVRINIKVNCTNIKHGLTLEIKKKSSPFGCLVCVYCEQIL